MASDLTFVRGQELYIFLSIDISGSTSYKRTEDDWPILFSTFFFDATNKLKDAWLSEFAELARKSAQVDDWFPHISVDRVRDLQPTIWKTLGDEIIFVRRVTTYFEIWISTVAFCHYVDDVADFLERKTADKKSKLSAKGTAWLAVFPLPNIQADIVSPQGRAGLSSKVIEFLGPSIDAGFRIGEYSRPGRCPVSVELARALARIMQIVGVSSFQLYMYYEEGESLKGLLPQSQTYPQIWINNDRGEQKTPKEMLLYRDSINNPELLIRVCDELIKNQAHTRHFFKLRERKRRLPKG